jgi:hypothetical protein
VNRSLLLDEARRAHRTNAEPSSPQ